MRSAALLLGAVLCCAGLAAASGDQTLSARADPTSSVATCPAGAYYWGLWQGKHYCVKCPAGTTSPGCTNCAPDPRRSTCTATGTLNCKRGKFVDAGAAKGISTCTDCPQGKWQSSQGQTGCYRCPKGMYQPFGGFWSCYKCAVGQYANEYGKTKCTGCTQCPRGQYGTTKAVGSVSAESCSCEECGAGKYAPAGYTKCFECPAGRFQPFGAKDRFSCYYCLPGQYQSGTGQSGCTKCAAGMTTSDRGATSASQCVAAKTSNHAAAPAQGCAVGSYKKSANLGDNKASTVCVTCPPGYYGRNVAGYGGHCFECTPGTYQPTRGAKTCLPCNAESHGPGFAPNTARTTCALLRCREGEAKTYSAASKQLVCAKCGPGSFDAGGTCQLCAEGRFQTNSGQTECQACPTGKVSGRGAAICTHTARPTPSPTPSPTPKYFQPGAISTIRMGNVTAAKLQAKQVVFEAALANLFTWNVHDIRVDRITNIAPSATGHACEVLKLSGYADNPQLKRLGTFYATADDVEGRPVYINRASGNFMYYYPAKQWWLVGPKVGSSVAGVLVQSQAMYPADIKEKFYAFNPTSGKWQTTFIGQACSRTTFVDVRFSLLASTCSGKEADAIRAAPRLLHASTKSLESSLDRMGLHVSSIVVQGKSSVRGCEPEIFLHLGKPAGAVALPKSACSFDGQRVTVRHAGSDHDSFACNHRFDEAANAFQCNCHSWKVDGKPSVWPSPKSKTTSAKKVTVATTTAKPITKTVVHCQLGDWSLWRPCDKSCEGKQSRVRVIERHPLNGGKKCPTDLAETRTCGGPCPKPEDCVMGVWGKWGECSKTCGGGIAVRKRSVLVAQSKGGKACPTDSDAAKCALAACEAHAVPEQKKFAEDPYNNWWLTDRGNGKDWPAYVAHLPKEGCCITCTKGQPCGTVCIDSHATCEKKPELHNWCACHHDVSQELQARQQKRELAKVAATECKPGSYEVAHLPNLCKECAPGTYQPRSNQKACLKCDAGFEPNRIGGATHCVAAATTTTKAPTTLREADATDCVVGSFPFKIVDGKKKWLWTPCSNPCGGGYQERARHLIEPTHGGKACPHGREYVSCNTQACPLTGAAPQAKGKDSTEYKEYLHSLEEQEVLAKRRNTDVFYSAVDAP